MNVDLGLLVLRVAVGGVVLAHGLLKIGWPTSMGARGPEAVRGSPASSVGWDSGRRCFGRSPRSSRRSAAAC
jgi:uncharacterized membrane protein YphA (DoxX/SURF4 family)